MKVPVERSILDLRGSHQPLVSYHLRARSVFLLKSPRVFLICCQHVNILPKVS